MDVKRKVGQLKQLRHLKGEVILLTQRLERLETEIEANAHCRWRGRAVVEHGARLIDLRDRLADRRIRCMAQLDALCGFIEGIEDSRLRQIMAGRYIDGLTWREVAAHIGERDEQYPRRLHNRFLAQAELPAALGAYALERREGDEKANR